jgi:hypothetical protein
MLFDLSADPAEANNVAVDHPDVVTRMTQVLEAWRASCRDSLAGKDYG